MLKNLSHNGTTGESGEWGEWEEWKDVGWVERSETQLRSCTNVNKPEKD